MKRKRSRVYVPAFIVPTLLALLFVTGWQPASDASSGASAQDPVAAKIDPRLLEAFTRTATPDVNVNPAQPSAKESAVSFWLLLADQPDLSAAISMESKEDKARYVYQTLRAFAERSQSAVRAELDQMGLKHQAFWISNAILVETDVGQDTGKEQLAQAERLELRRQQVLQLATRPDVARLDLAERGLWALDVKSAETSPPAQPARFADFFANLPGKSGNLSTVRAQAQFDDMPVNVSSLDFVRAWEVWESGATGRGLVIGTIDTGVRWDHEALKVNYRGWKRSSVNHNYNWWDGLRSGASLDNVCGNASPVPCDDLGHGTHTMGTAVGRTAVDVNDGLTKQIGIAPGAKWIACRGFDQGLVVPGAVENCLQFLLAPTDLNGQNPNPDKGPDVLSNSYGVPDTPVLKLAFDALNAAGVYLVASAGNFASCRSIAFAPGMYESVLTVGALAYNGSLGISSDNFALFSSRGPNPQSLVKPDLAAPGQAVTSADRDGGLIAMSGTSMSSPLVAGAVALVWEGRPNLRGNINGTTELFHRTGRHRSNGQCGSPQTFPNYVYGYGNLDAKATFDNNRSPLPTCQDMTVNASNSCFARASINNGSVDPDGDALRFTQAPLGPYPVGDTFVTLNVTDRRGARNFCQATVTVLDATPPVISRASASPSVIWPANNRMVNVAVNYMTSDCTDVTTSLSVSSNEPVAVGDMVVLNANLVSLRATRLGSGKGRIYTITISASDSSGNPSSRQLTVTVPRDR